MTTKGTPQWKIRVEEDVWKAAMAAFPATPGIESGLPAEVRAFVAFLAERPDDWKAVKVEAEARGADPWQVIAEALTAR